MSTRGAVILAGGHGSRLGGVNKALLDVGGMPILQRIINAIKPHAGRITLVVNDESLAHFGLPLFRDGEPHAGVLPALLTGLRACHEDYCLVTACDMPFIQPRLIQALFQLADGHDVCIPEIEGRPEPMLAVYRREPCIAAIETSLRAGRMRMIAFLDTLEVVRVDEDTMRPFDAELRSFINVNEPLDLERARMLAAQQS